MRRRARIDENQPDIVAALRKAGCSVLCLHMLGKGAPDILVGVGGRNILMEIKDGKKVQSARKLTPDESDFHAEWRGQVAVVGSAEEALKAISYMKAEKV